MGKTLTLLTACLLSASSSALAQWTCNSAIPVDLPSEQNWIETYGPDSWGHWNRFALDYAADVKIVGSAPYVPGWVRVRLWTDCEGGQPEGLVGQWESVADLSDPVIDSGPLRVEPGAYFVELRAFTIVDFDTLFVGGLRIDVKAVVDAQVLSTINPRSRGTVPVAIFGSQNFDVADLDGSTLRFGQDEAAPRHDLTDTWTHNEHVQDIDLDGVPDLIVHFATQETGIRCEDEVAVLRAVLLDGTPVETTLSVRTVGCRFHGALGRWATESFRHSADSPAGLTTPDR